MYTHRNHHRYRKGEQLWEIDKRNQKFVVMGTDYWADVRKALGE